MLYGCYLCHTHLDVPHSVPPASPGLAQLQGTGVAAGVAAVPAAVVATAATVAAEVGAEASVGADAASVGPGSGRRGRFLTARDDDRYQYEQNPQGDPVYD